MYSVEHRVGYSEVDSESHLKPLALVNLLQDCCTFQSEEVGNGVAVLKKIDRAWILISWQIVIKKHPKLNEKIRITTYPYEFKAFFGCRCFDIVDESGETCVIANSVWAYMDTKAGRPARVDKDVQQRYGIDEMIPYDWMDRKIKVSGEFLEQEDFRVRSFCIDTNNHVNNAWYVEISEEYLPDEFAYNSVRVEYQKSAVLGDVLHSKMQITDEKCTVILYDENDEIYTITEFIA